jgi:radical SAM superfamily enzyme YgiQ (UPF0313 family)
MVSHQVLLVAFKELDNLGVGYLASMLSEAGFEPLIVDFRDGKEEILKKIKKLKPLVIGFSVIFQYYIHDFRELIGYLRKSGINSHFCAGGQYASMRYEDLLKLIPGLNSIVRFEGEYTFLELVKNIHTGTDWRNIKGVSFKENGKVIVNPLRRPELDLDRFPFPMRSPLKEYALNKKFATIIAGRGCINNCAFCNNTEYIRQSLMPFKRLRKPEKVVEEIDFLYSNHDCRIFLFEDDDFPVKTGNGSDWIEKFCKELRRKKLSDKILWKINCRADEVDHNGFALMKSHGLYMVFLGIDDGTDIGLARLNKHMTVAECLRGINILKALDIGFDYGFMLFQPSSTFKSVHQNLSFLRKLCSDGTAPVTFLKLMPYFNTKVEKELREEGRLTGKPGLSDYKFQTISLDRYYKFIGDSFMEWINDAEGLVNIIKWSVSYFSVFSRFYKMTPEVESLRTDVRKCVAESNKYITETMQEIAVRFDQAKGDSLKISDLKKYRENIRKKHNQYKAQIVNSVKRVCRIAECQRLKQIIYH